MHGGHTNDSEEGVWKRIAEASEDAFAGGVSTQALEGIIGYQLRTAKAIEAATAVLSGKVQYVATRTQLADIHNPVALQSAILTEAGCEGEFVFDDSDLSAEVTLDTAQGIYVAPSSDTTGANGAWVRKYHGRASPRWFGVSESGTGSANKTALQVAINVAKYLHIDLDFSTDGGVVLPSGTNIEGAGGTITLTGAGDKQLFHFGVLSGTLGVDAQDISVCGVNFYSTSSTSNLRVFFLENAGATTDGIRVEGNTMRYEPDTLPEPGDAQFFAGRLGDFTAPTWLNVSIVGNKVLGPMQLIASVGNAYTKHWKINDNFVSEGRANAIYVSSGSGSALNPSHVEDMEICRNTIYSTTYTGVGINVGLDDDTGDRDMDIVRVRIAGNKIYMTGASAGACIQIRGGNDCSGIGGFASSMDGIEISGNECYTLSGQYAISVSTVDPATAAVAYITNSFISNNKILQGDMRIGYMSECELKGNVVNGRLSVIRSNLIIRSSGNTYQYFLPDTSATYELHFMSDRFIGRPVSFAASEWVLDINPDTGKTQTLYLNACTINSRQTGTNAKSAVRTNGAGAAAVHIRGLMTSTTWNAGLYTQTTGAINDYNIIGLYTPTISSLTNCSGVTVTKAIYERHENFVRVSAVLAGTSTAAGAVRFKGTLPVASNLTSTSDLIGTCCTQDSAAPLSGYIIGDTSNDLADFHYVATAGAAFTLNAVFQYQVR